MTPDDLARLFHETYERLAPAHGYETRKASAVAWEDVPANNKSLMTAVAAEVLAAVLPALTVRITVTCDCGTVIDQYTGSVAEKYPFTCPECDDIRHDKYPWKISTEIIRNEKR